MRMRLVGIAAQHPRRACRRSVARAQAQLGPPIEHCALAMSIWCVFQYDTRPQALKQAALTCNPRNPRQSCSTYGALTAGEHRLSKRRIRKCGVGFLGSGRWSNSPEAHKTRWYATLWCRSSLLERHHQTGYFPSFLGRLSRCDTPAPAAPPIAPLTKAFGVPTPATFDRILLSGRCPIGRLSLTIYDRCVIESGRAADLIRRAASCARFGSRWE
jgi:hypothetical protein